MKKLVAFAALTAMVLTLFVPSFAVAAERPDRGDATADGAINMKDVLADRKYVADLGTELDFEAGDCNGDEEINMKDVLILRKYVAGLDASFAAYKMDDYAPFYLKTLAQEQVVLSFYNEDASDLAVTWHTTRKNYRPVAQVVKAADGAQVDFANAIEFAATTEEFKDLATLYDGEANAFEIVSKIGYKEQIDYTHRAILGGLEPNTTYVYRVGDGAKKIWSDTYTFTTRPETVEEFSFVWMSDTQVTDTRDQTASHFMNDAFKGASQVDPNFSFVLHGGDVVQTSHYLHQWQMMINGNEEYLAQYPVMMATGNHDASNDTAGDYEIYKHMTFNLPEPNSKKSYGTYYSFDYGDAHFICLDTCYGKGIRSANVDNEQKTWLQEDLKNTTKQWKIVMLHVPIVSYKNINSSSLTRMFAENGVDLVLQGDEHVYLRSQPINDRNKPVNDTELRTVDGVKYYVNPVGAIFTQAATAGDSQQNINSASVNPVNLATQGNGRQSSWANISIKGNTLTMQTYYYNNGNIQLYTDGSWGIIKE